LTQAGALSPQAALAKWFPGKSFRDQQKAVCDRTFAGRSTLVLMPTGMGKSLLFQLPVLAMGGIGVVFSPLIALMRQQSEVLTNLGATVLSLGGYDPLEAQKALRDFPWRRGGSSFIFVSPERAETDGYFEFLLREHAKNIRLVAVDEAHCISQWGNEFRPEYKAIPNVLDRSFGAGSWPSILCLTATLDANSQAEIIRDFRLSHSDVVRSPNMLRTNLNLSFHVCEDSPEKLRQLQGLLGQHRGEKLIVYTHLKKNKKAGTRALSELFAAAGFECAPFDADQSLEEKDRTLTGFLDGSIKVIFATGAFGMGVDISDVRGVIHFLLPESLEQYYQEVGRAGRDGKPAFGALLYTPKNAKVRRDMIAASRRTAEQVTDMWNGVCGAGGPGLRTVNVWSEFQGKDDEHALFYAFQRIGVLNVVARAPGRLQSFEGCGPVGLSFLNTLRSATVTGSLAAAIRKLNLNPSATVRDIYDLYDRGEIKLVRSPDKTLFFTTKEFCESDADMIVSEIAARVQTRLEKFNSFVELVESESDPEQALRARFA
jgi:ATP-dependent DNA helicase RecQ